MKDETKRQLLQSQNAFCGKLKGSRCNCCCPYGRKGKGRRRSARHVRRVLRQQLAQNWSNNDAL